MRTATRLLASLLLLPAPTLFAQGTEAPSTPPTPRVTEAQAPATSGSPAAPAAAATATPGAATPSGEAAPAAPTPEGTTQGASPDTATSAAAPAPTPASTPVALPPPPPLTPREATNSLSDTDVKQALELIRSSYVDATAFTDDELARATLQGLLERLGSGVVIEEAATPAENHPLRAEILDDRIGYVRMGSLSADALTELDAALENFKAKQLRSVILDFRATPPSGNYELAAEYIKRLAPKGKMLFGLRSPGNKQERMFTSSFDSAFDGVIVSVVNRHTAGAPEVIAASLREVSNALVVGQKTAGQAAEFGELTLRGGKRVRVAIGELNLPGDRDIFPSGLTPDLAVEVSPKVEAEVLQIGLEKGVGGLVFERERARLNEAALVAGENPELDEAALSQRQNGRRSQPLDRTLQRAVDLITTIHIFAGTQR